MKKKRTKEEALWYSAKKRAEKAGLAFTIQVADVVIPKICPVLGIPLSISNTGRFVDSSPSLDRRNNDFGYVPDNVEVISMRANRIMCDASLDEIRRLYKWMLLRTLPMGDYQ